MELFQEKNSTPGTCIYIDQLVLVLFTSTIQFLNNLPDLNVKLVARDKSTLPFEVV
jgi:hypothetical protein